MLLIFISWLYCLVLAYTVGSLSQEIFRLAYKGMKRWSPLLTVIVGLPLSSAIAAFLSLFLPVDISLHGLLLAIVGLGLFIFRPSLISPLLDTWQSFQVLPKIYRVFLIVICCYLGLLLCFRSAIGLFGYDTSYYHAPSIQWIERFPAVSGLGNFFGPLANNSLWFIVLALFDLAPRSDTPTHGIGFLWLGLGILNAVLGASGIGALGRGISSVKLRYTSIFWLLSLLPLIFLYNYYASYSTSTDLPASVLVILIMGFFLEYIEQDENEQDKRSWALLIAILIPFAIDIKLSTAPLLLLLFWVSYQETRQHGWKFLGIIIGIISLLFTPQILRNIILSGYLIYPFPSIDLFSVDWKVSIAQVIAEKHSIEGWSRFPNIDPEKVLQGGFNFWFPTWFHGIPNSPDVRFLGFKNTLEGRGLAASILIFFASLAISWRKTFRIVKPAAIAYLTGIIGIIFWFISAPDLRFGYGFIWSVIILLCLPTMMQICQGRVRCWALVLIVGAIVIISPIERTQYWYSLFSRFDWHFQPMPYPDPINRQWIVGKQTFFIPTEEDRCWHLFPCTPKANPKLQLRGNSIGEGFIVQSQNF